MSVQDPQQGLVLDTHVVLDWLWFGDPRLSTLGSALRQRRLNWLATAAMRSEFQHVLRRLPPLPGRAKQEALTSFEAYAVVVEPQVRSTAIVPRCSDPSDQMFIDLGAASGSVLLSRDRAVLKLARRMEAFGCRVCTPEAYALVARASGTASTVVMG